jgi:hypothetical protein
MQPELKGVATRLRKTTKAEKRYGVGPVPEG